MIVFDVEEHAHAGALRLRQSFELVALEHLRPEDGGVTVLAVGIEAAVETTRPVR